MHHIKQTMSRNNFFVSVFACTRAGIAMTRSIFLSCNIREIFMHVLCPEKT